MSPTYTDGQLLFACPAIECEFEDLQIDDVIVFEAPDLEDNEISNLIVHRITDIDNDSDTVVTASDNPDRRRYDTVTEEQYKGKIASSSGTTSTAIVGDMML